MWLRALALEALYALEGCICASQSTAAYIHTAPCSRYTVRLLFNEFEGKAAKERKMKITINSVVLAEKFDIADSVGEGTAAMVEALITTDGSLFIQLEAVKGTAILSGIEILRGDQLGTAQIAPGLENAASPSVSTLSSTASSTTTALPTVPTVPPTTTQAPTTTTSIAPFVDFEVFINCGAKKSLTDRKGNTWVASGEEPGFVKNRLVRNKRTRKKVNGPNPSKM